MSDKIASYIPPEDALNSVEQVFDELEGIKEILTDNKKSTVRLVMNAEKMSIKETMRTLTYLNLYGFKVDMVLVMVLVGFESIKQSTLEAYNKGHVNSADQFVRLIEECRQAGLNVQGNFLVNPSLESYKDMDDLVKFVSKNNIFMPIFQIITPYPGTTMYWEKYNAMNLVIRSEKYDPVKFQHKFMTSYYKAYSWKNIANRVRVNPYKLLNLVTSLAFKKNLREQLGTFELEEKYQEIILL